MSESRGMEDAEGHGQAAVSGFGHGACAVEGPLRSTS